MSRQYWGALAVAMAILGDIDRLIRVVAKARLGDIDRIIPTVTKAILAILVGQF